MLNIQGQSVPNVTPLTHIVSATHGERLILLDPLRGRYYSLNKSGARVWAQLCEAIPVTTIIERMAAEDEQPVGQIEQEISDLLAALIGASLVARS